ncbi:glycosyl hydrolase [Paenibacillus spongiae]|uniref:beta-fructofuranosidase n=1 Tax=Paenibacillus spongiae TaxID=2909671 RepID=A0ABY5S5H6_9BACL|nr:glycosyl hydrolase [Paenibacillus spongiae]UVI29162.1 glycosyl hydrolase [Paenibacillus spongiae]
MMNVEASGYYLELMNNQVEASLDWGSIKAFTIRALLTGGADGIDFLTIAGEDGTASIRFHAGGSSDRAAHALIAEILTDAKDRPITLSVPWQAIGDGRHDVLLRWSGHLAELYVDGVLVDEDWPMGAVRLEQSIVRAHEGTHEAKIWGRTLTDAELTLFIGDEQERRERELAYLGKEQNSLQYWRPRGFNTSVGDCMPFFDGETFHIYYLFDRRGHGSKWGLGAHQWAHISSKDLKQWEHHPMAVGITQEWEGSICTGSVILENGIYYAFYAVRAVDGSPAQLTWAASADGIHFEKSESYIPVSSRYTLASVRDPHVFKDAEGLYHMLITTSLDEGNKREGCLAHLVSKDLHNWREEEPFIVPGYHGEPECSDYFEWNGWYYLVFSNDGLARYRYSREPFGPWLRPAMDTIDGVQMRVPKTAGFPDGRRLAVGFLSGPGRYGGELVIRELVQHDDGSLGLKLPEELIDLSGQVETDGANMIEIGNLNGFAEQIWGETEGEYALFFEVFPEHPTMFYGFSVADTADFQRGNDIRFEPSNRKIGIHAINSAGFIEDEVSSIYHVDGLDRRVSVQVFVKECFIDLCVNGERTIISRINNGHAYLRFFSQFGTAAFHKITVRREE